MKHLISALLFIPVCLSLVAQNEPQLWVEGNNSVNILIDEGFERNLGVSILAERLAGRHQVRDTIQVLNLPSYAYQNRIEV